MHQKSPNVIYAFTESHFAFKAPPNFWETKTWKDGEGGMRLTQPTQEA